MSMGASFRPASLFSDGAVLCRDKEIRIFGEAPEGAEITARLSGARGETLAEGRAQSREGRFLLFLPPQQAQSGCTLELSAGGEKITAREIAIGDVYLAGGQSNMELELRNALGGEDLIQSGSDPLLRFYNVPRNAYVSERQQAEIRETRWHAADPDHAGYNSAVSSFFAAAMRRRHPEVPVGIIGCYWGGTSATCWMDGETLENLGEGRKYLERYASEGGGKSMETYLKEEKVFQDNLDAWNKKVERFRQKEPEATWEQVTEHCGLCPWNPPAGPGSPYRPAGLYETMLKAVMPATLTAILYYQGEEDAGKTDHYDDLMIALIRLWRAGFREETLPFFFVQLPMWLDFGAEDTFRWPLTRLAQAKARDAMRNTGMICLLDQGEYGNIHPVDKRPVGERLAELVCCCLYGSGKVSPRVKARTVRDGKMVLKLSAPAVTKDGQPPRLMEIAGEDGRFVKADCEIRGDKLVLSSPEVPRPAGARYAWTDYSADVNLFGENGLPVEPFLV